MAMEQEGSLLHREHHAIVFIADVDPIRVLRQGELVLAPEANSISLQTGVFIIIDQAMVANTFEFLLRGVLGGHKWGEVTLCMCQLIFVQICHNLENQVL